MTGPVPSCIRVLVVDDEPLARRGIRQCIGDDPEVEIVGECANGQEAIEAIRRDPPDLLFLDVQMPGVDGFDVLEAVGVERVPAVVFVTAYDRYAVRAFDVHAADYLLKPFDEERFAVALQRAKAAARASGTERLGKRLAALVEDYRAATGLSQAGSPEYLHRLAVKERGRIHFLRVAEIDWVEAADQYAILHTGASNHIVRESLSSLEAQLDPRSFFRLHRSTIVNLERVRSLEPGDRGDGEVLLRDGTRLRVSRTRREGLESALLRTR